MRTNIEIDDELMLRAMKAAGATTKKAAVEAALRLTVQLKKQGEIRRLFGKIKWEGDLASMRKGRFLDWEAEREKENASRRPAPQASVVR
ncbi:MAG: type II toxin-antitoxin system VapB family antitoxin [Terracidiphilus sp.]|jgi:Arc/MetJ family transcription regulator